ncbi:hypothetical protein ABPG73_009196 [Tetrahymena malaccensis]
MEGNQNELSASLNEITSQPPNSKFDNTLNKRNRKKLKYNANDQEFILQHSIVKDEDKCDLNQNILEDQSTEQHSVASQEYDITVNKRFKKKNSGLNGSESLSEIQAKSNEISFEYNQDGSLYQQSSEVTDSNISKEDELESIGKISTSRQANKVFFFNNSVSQHRLLSKQLERMKSKCSLNLQLNKLDSKKDSQEDDENEVEEDEDDEEVEYEDEDDDSRSSKLNYQKIEQDSKQKSWKKRLANDYLILEILGNGGQGKVATFLDKSNNNIIALKEFARIQEFDRESQIYKFLQEHTDLHDYINLMLDEDRSQRQIKMQMGCCNLYEMYIHMKNYNTSFPKNQICWEQDHLVKIFRQLIHGLIAFRRNKFFHGDIKPHNLMLFSVENVFNHYMVKYIDLGAAGFEEKEYYEFYSDQFYHPEYLDMIVMKEYVLSEVEVNICEIFAIIRSIWIIICFEREDVNNFKQYPDLDFGIKFIKSKYPRLASLIQKVVDFKGDLDLIEKTINEDQLNESIVNPMNSLCLVDPFKMDEYKQKYCHFDITQNYLKLSDQMKELIQNIIQMKKEKFINEQSEDQLQELFEILYSLGQDQRALEIFHKLESSYEKQFKVLLGEEKSKSESKKLSEESIQAKVRVIKESIILLNEKGELDKAIFWNKKILSLYSSTKWKDNREAIQATIQYSILLNTKGDVMSSLQMSKDARNKYKELVFQQVQQNKEAFKIQLQRDSLYGYICQVIGRLYVEINSFSNGLKYLKLALQIFECIKKQNINQDNQLNHNEGEIDFEDLNNMIQLTLIKLSQASLFLRHNNKALEYIDAAIQLGKQMYGERLNKQLASCLNIKSHILKQQNQDLQALELQNKCLEIRLKIHNQVDHRFISNSLNSISLLESKLGFHEQALQNQEQCYQMRLRLYQKNNPFHNQIISCLRNFGLIYLKKGDNVNSEKFFLQAFELADKSNDLFSKMNSLKMLEKYYKQVHGIENYKKYQNLRIQTKLQILEVKKNMQIQKEYQNSINQSKRKMSSQTDIVVTSPINQNQQVSDEETINDSSESKQLKKSNYKKQQKVRQSLESSQLSSQDQIQLTKSYPIEITQSIIINKVNDNKKKNSIKSVANVKSQSSSSSGEIQAEKAIKPRPKYKKKTRNIQLNSIIIEESIQEIKEEANEKAGFSTLLESQPIKDQQLEKQNYKKNDGKKHQKKKTNKSQSEIGEIPTLDEDNNNTVSLNKQVQKQQEEDTNDIFKETQKVIKNKSDTLPDIDFDKNQKSLQTAFQRGKTKSYQEQISCEDNQKITNQNAKATNNKQNPNNLFQSNDKKHNKYKKYQKGKNSNLNKSNKDLFQEQEYIEVIQTESKQQPKQDLFEEKKC